MSSRESAGQPALSREQLRAQRAAAFVKSVDGEGSGGPGDVRARYNTLIHKLPIWIRTNGVLQTMAFLAAKQGNNDKPRQGPARAAELVLQHVREHLVDAGLMSPKGDLLDVIAKAEGERYSLIQEEAMRAAAWHKRFAAATWGDEDEIRGAS